MLNCFPSLWKAIQQWLIVSWASFSTVSHLCMSCHFCLKETRAGIIFLNWFSNLNFYFFNNSDLNRAARASILAACTCSKSSDWGLGLLLDVVVNHSQTTLKCSSPEDSHELHQEKGEQFCILICNVCIMLEFIRAELHTSYCIYMSHYTLSAPCL